MSRLESNPKPRFELKEKQSNTSSGVNFEIDKPKPIKQDEVLKKLGDEALNQFDYEMRLEQVKKKAEAQLSRGTTKDVAYLLGNATLLFKNKEWSLAANLYRQVLNTDSYCLAAIRGLGECFSALDKNEKAIECFHSLVQLDPTSENFILLADAFYVEGQIEAAKKCYLKSVVGEDFDPELVFNVYKNLGNIYLKEGDLDTAEDFYNKCYAINPNSDVLLVNYGSLEVCRGDLSKAVARFRSAAEANPNNENAWVGLAMVHRQHGDQELSWANIEKSLDINPGFETAIKFACDWAIKDNFLEKAIYLLSNYLNKNDQDPFISMMLAKFLYLSGRIQQAKTEIMRSINLDPNFEEAQAVMAVIEEEISKRGL